MLRLLANWEVSEKDKIKEASDEDSWMLQAMDMVCSLQILMLEYTYSYAGGGSSCGY